MARPTAEDRRVDYLRIGADLVSEFDLSRATQVPLDALANVKVADVAVRAGVTKGALYHIWESQEAYRRDLLAHLLDDQDQAGLARAQEIMDSVDMDAGLDLAMREMSSQWFNGARNDPRLLARFSFYNYADDPGVNQLLARGAEAYEPFYETYLALSGRRMRAPFTVQLLVTVTSAFFNGMVLRYRTSPDLVDAQVMRNGEPWTLYPYGLLALIEHFTEPDEQAG